MAKRRKKARTMEKSFFRKIFELVFTLAFLYGLVVAGMYFGQRHLMYFPDTSPTSIQSASIKGFQDLTVTTEDRLKLTGWFHPPLMEDYPVVIWFHGNGGKFSDREQYVGHYISSGYGIVLASYRGYGGNVGTPTEENLYKDARAYIREIERRGYPVIVYGESLGSGVAVQMAVENPNIRAVILHSPYTSTTAIAAKKFPLLPVNLLMLDRFENDKKLFDIRAPIFFMHGKRDNLIPVEHSEQLFELANEPKKIKLFYDTNHMNLYSHGANAAVLRFLQYDVRQKPYLQ